MARACTGKVSIGRLEKERIRVRKGRRRPTDRPLREKENRRLGVEKNKRRRRYRVGRRSKKGKVLERRRKGTAGDKKKRFVLALRGKLEAAEMRPKGARLREKGKDLASTREKRKKRERWPSCTHGRRKRVEQPSS